MFFASRKGKIREDNPLSKAFLLTLLATFAGRSSALPVILTAAKFGTFFEFSKFFVKNLRKIYVKKEKRCILHSMHLPKFNNQKQSISTFS